MPHFEEMSVVAAIVMWFLKRNVQIGFHQARKSTLNQ